MKIKSLDHSQKSMSGPEQGITAYVRFHGRKKNVDIWSQHDLKRSGFTFQKNTLQSLWFTIRQHTT